MLHIGIIWANPYSNNLGVSALAYSSLALLDDVCKENNVDADFTLIGNKTKKENTVCINNRQIKFHFIEGNSHLKWRSLAKLAFFPRRYNTRLILNLDIVFDISEGDSFTDIYGEKRHAKFLNSKIFFNLLGKHQVLLPQTIGPFKSRDNEKKAFRVMNKMEMVISRDKQSLEYTAKFLPENKITEAIDVAFYLPFKKKVFGTDKVHVGINISALLFNGGYTKKNQFDLQANYRSLIEKTVTYFTSLENVTVHFVSHVISRRKSVEDDFTAAEEFHKHYPGTILAPVFETPIEAKSYISGLDFFIGSRMHACIAAFSSGVPVFPMAYSRKFNGLFGETLKYKWYGDCINENEEVIFNNLKEAFERRVELDKAIDYSNNTIVSVRLDNLKKQLLKLIKDVGVNHK